MRAGFLISLVVCAASVRGGIIESGTFRLHKFEQPIGEETYRIEQQSGDLNLTADFHFRDRATPVDLKATLRLKPDYTPERLDLHGKTSRFSTVNVTRDGASGQKPAFSAEAYAPVSVQMALVRYWVRHGRPAEIARIPSGTLRIEARGRDTIELDGQKKPADRYTVEGLIWGRETLWLDPEMHLLAAVTVDAEFDHFEAIRDGWEPALSFFVARAAEDNMQALADLSRTLQRDEGRVLAITGATLIDGTDRPPVRDAIILVENGRIRDAGSRSRVRIPAGAAVFDARGKFVLPGLWDTHAHFEQVEWGPLYLGFGITTARDCGNEFDFITAVRKAIDSGRGLGPRLLLGGIVDGNGPGSIGIIRANNAGEARAVVARYHDAGFDQIKIYSSVRPEVVKALSAEAHRLGMTAYGHVPIGMSSYEAVEDGMDGIEHFEPYLHSALLGPKVKPMFGSMAPFDLQSQVASDAIAFFRSHHTVIGPTVALFELMGHPLNTPVETFEPGAKHVAPEMRDGIEETGLPADRAAKVEAAVRADLTAIAAFRHAGVPIIAGTDQAVPGYSLYRELELYVEGGMTPLEAIQTATLVPARVLGRERESGTVEAGKRADLAILDADPLENIHNIRSVRYVVAAGRLFDCAPLRRAVGFETEPRP